MTKETLDEPERLHEAATKAPWFIEGQHNDYTIMGNRTGSQNGWSIADNVFDLDARQKDAARQERDANLVLAARNSLPELLRSARLALKAREWLQVHGVGFQRCANTCGHLMDNAATSRAEFRELLEAFGLPPLICQHCEEPLVESEGVEVRGNLWHQECYRSWREDD